MEIIDVKGLTKKYGSFTAVDNVEFTVNEGEIFGILGPNGAGKTTTLEMIEGLKRITAGSVKVAGFNVASQTEKVKSAIGVQLQATSFFDGLSLVELIETFASLYNRTVDPNKILESVQLKEKAASKVKELSGGQKQRFSIAVALVNDPKVIFLDEPTTGLDPQARRHLWDLVSQIRASGKTVVLTTHYMEEAEVLCDRIAIMDNAQIIALDTTQNLLAQTGVHPVVSFQTRASLHLEALEQLPGVTSARQDNTTYSITTTRPQQTLDGLFALARQQRFDIDQLQLNRATLEDVFLKLTGHALRE